MKHKKNGAKGTKNAKAKLRNIDIICIRAVYRLGLSTQERHWINNYDSKGP